LVVVVVVVVMVMEQQLLLMFLRHPRFMQLALEGDEGKQIVAQVIMARQRTLDDRVGVRVILVVANGHGHAGSVQTAAKFRLSRFHEPTVCVDVLLLTSLKCTVLSAFP
jgi:hypothetical protein